MIVAGQSDKMASNVEVCMKERCDIKFLHAEKKWHPPCHSWTLAEHVWRPNNGGEHSEAEGDAVQQW